MNCPICDKEIIVERDEKNEHVLLITAPCGHAELIKKTIKDTIIDNFLKRIEEIDFDEEKKKYKWNWEGDPDIKIITKFSNKSIEVKVHESILIPKE